MKNKYIKYKQRQDEVIDTLLPSLNKCQWRNDETNVTIILQYYIYLRPRLVLLKILKMAYFQCKAKYETSNNNISSPSDTCSLRFQVLIQPNCSCMEKLFGVLGEFYQLKYRLLGFYRFLGNFKAQWDDSAWLVCLLDFCIVTMIIGAVKSNLHSLCALQNRLLLQRSL